jgi:hypothetical protein
MALENRYQDGDSNEIIQDLDDVHDVVVVWAEVIRTIVYDFSCNIISDSQ